MPASPTVRAQLEGERMLGTFKPAIGETLDAFTDDEQILDWGYDGHWDGYFFITQRGLHYCDKVKTGFFSKSLVAKFLPREQITSGSIDQISGPDSAFLRLYDDDKNMLFVIWFAEEVGPDVLGRAHRAAEALNLA